MTMTTAGMRSYFNGATPPPASAGPGRPHPVTSGRLVTGRASSSSLPRSPDQDNSLLTSGLGTGSGSGQSGHGSLGSHSSHEVSYMNIYQNTNIPHIYDTNNIEGSPRHSLGSNNSSNLSTPPSPARDMGSSSYES